MLDFTFNLPTLLKFGRDAEDAVGRLVRDQGGTRALVLYGGGSAVRSGLLDRVLSSLEAAGIPASALGGVRPNPLSDLVRTAIGRARADGADFIVGVGGGSVIDTAKAVAAGVPYEGDFWDFYGGAASPAEALPVGVVLTTAATGSEADGDSVITDASTRLKREANGACLRPRFALMDPALTCTLPAFQTACGIFDIMSHLIEAYLTATPDVAVSDRLLEGVMLAVIDESSRVLADPGAYGPRANIMWAANIALNGMAGAGRAQDWASHEIEYALSSRYGIAHGAGLAVVHPAVLEASLRARPEAAVPRLAQLAVRVWGCRDDFFEPERSAAEGIDRLRSWARGLGLPTALREVPGARRDDIDSLARETCHAGGRAGAVGGFAAFDEAAVAAILESAW